MVQLLEELPPELQAYIAGSLDDAAASGRWAKASRASRLLLLPRIDQLLEARRSARQQAVFDKLGSRRGAAAALSVYDMGNGVAAIRVLPFKLDKFTCMCCPGNYELSIGAGGIKTRCGTSLPGCIGRPTDSRCIAWALIRSHGTHLRLEHPNLLVCRGVQQT